jgi:nucleotide-binding universal stress UspA family protein
MGRILVATDGSESANRAVDAAAQLAKRLDARLLIVNAIDDNGLPPEDLNKFMREEGISLGDALSSMSALILNHAEEQARKQGISNVETESRSGDAAEVVLEIVRKNGVEAIVVGRRGRGRVSGLLLGSISQKLVTLAPCMVIVIP